MKYDKIELKVPGQQTGAALLTVYLLDSISVAPGRLRPMVIVVPGGGYSRCSDRESEPVAMKYLAMGYDACILNYSVSPNRYPTALRELALAVAVIRGHAAEWRIKSDGIFVCGFSAGGHLACSLGTFWDQQEVYEPIGCRPEEVRPDGLILCYPVITSGEFCHAGSFVELLGEAADEKLRSRVSLENQISSRMPPVFLWHTVTDQSVPVENSLLLAAALQRARVSFEMHLYPSGCHGLALASEETGGSEERLVEPCCQTWISLVQSWIENRTKNE